MAKNLMAPIGTLLALVGLLWTLQGLDVVGGSPMSGVTLWAVIGPVVVMTGMALVVLAIRGRGRP